MAVRILLITPQFYGIERKIKSVLEESNYEVTWFENKTLPFDYHGTSSKLKLLRRAFYLLLSPHKRYLRRELRKIENPEFDILFSVNANIICPYLFRKLKSINPQLKTVLYLWDSFSMYNWSGELKLFDKVLTFDRADSINYGIEYKPNFYIKSNISSSYEKEYDLFFVGKFSPDRLTIIDKLESLPEMSGIRCYIKLWPAYRIFFHSHLIYRLLKRLDFKTTWVQNYTINFEAVEGIIEREYLAHESLNYEEMQYILLRSNVILDLPYRRQTGYTHRLIEALANGRKVLTTNSNIRNESFYNPEQIHILDEKKPEIDNRWTKEKSAFPIESYFSGLELSEWLKSIINVRIA
jgi:hypothetical protein